ELLIYNLSSHPFPPLWQVHGSVRTINRGNPAGHEVLVDTWPDFKAVLTRPRPEVVIDHLDSYTNTYVAYYRDVGAYRDLLGSAITRNQSFRIHGNIGPTTPGKLSMYLLFGSNPRIPPKSIISPSPVALCSPRLDPAVRLSSLDVSHLDLVNEMWAIGGNKHSRRYLESLIRRFPNFCLLDTSDNPVSWGLSDMFGAIICTFTLPQHRGHGYNGALNILVAKHLHAQGYPCYGHVAPENFPIQRHFCLFLLFNISPCHGRDQVGMSVTGFQLEPCNSFPFFNQFFK
uniref:Glycine N-acyltransferase-like protein n=1 Tax=Pelusios castaneus TaxID=367368 RepID=A0A8C8VHZ3_9SAUR